MAKEIIVSDNPNVLADNQVSFDERAKMLNRLAEDEMQAKEKAEKSPFKNFAQLNRDNLAHVIKACSDNTQAVRILLFIIEHMDRYNALVCSYKVFQEHLNISRPTITRAIKYLKDNGFLAIYKAGACNVYVINDNLVWTNKGSKLKYCKFPANVILSAAEQEEINQIKQVKFDNVKQLHTKNKGAIEDENSNQGD